MKIIYIGNEETAFQKLTTQIETDFQVFFHNINDHTNLGSINKLVSSYDILLLEVDHAYGISYHIASTIEHTFFVLTNALKSDEKNYMLTLGALDYIDISRGMSELGLKLRNFKRSFNVQSLVVRIDDFLFNFENYTVTQSNIMIKLSKKQNIILYHLVKNKGKIVTRDELLTEVWGNSPDLETRTIDSHIKTIRKVLLTDCIVTIRGVGYMYVDNCESLT